MHDIQISFHILSYFLYSHMYFRLNQNLKKCALCFENINYYFTDPLNRNKPKESEHVVEFLLFSFKRLRTAFRDMAIFNI